MQTSFPPQFNHSLLSVLGAALAGAAITAVAVLAAVVHNFDSRVHDDQVRNLRGLVDYNHSNITSI